MDCILIDHERECLVDILGHEEFKLEFGYFYGVTINSNGRYNKSMNVRYMYNNISEIVACVTEYDTQILPTRVSSSHSSAC